MNSDDSSESKSRTADPSRFDLLCAALGRINDQYTEYRQDCSLFVGMFRDRLQSFLGAPDGTVVFYARHGVLNGRRVDGPAAAMHLADDAWWQFGMMIDVLVEEGEIPIHHVGFDARLKKLGAQFHLQMEDQPVVVIDEGNDRQLESVFERMFLIVKGRYDNAFEEFLQTGDPRRRFGF